ncbi:S24 family peptidase [Tsuneonella sp. HG094]
MSIIAAPLMMGIPTIGQVGFPASAVFSDLWENPPMVDVPDNGNLAQVLPARLRERIDALPGKSMRSVSLAIGAHAGYVRDLFDAERFNVPSSTRMHALAIELETTTDYLMGVVDEPGQVKSEVGIVRSDRLPYRGMPAELPPIPLVGTGDCATLEVLVEGTRGKRVQVERSTFDPDYTRRFIRRPAALAGANDLYAIEFHGDSMVRRFEPGDIGLVDPRRPVRAGDYVLVQLREAPGTNTVGSVLAKRLVRQNAHEYVLEQFNPELTFIIPKEDVVRIHPILRPNDLLF